MSSTMREKLLSVGRPLWRTAVTAGIGCAVMCGTLFSTGPALAHGERNQEPFLRMRTLLWYDGKWSTKEIGVFDGQSGGELVLTGKFHVFDDWPQNIAKPDETAAFLSTAGPGSVLVKKESYINGSPMIQSTQLKRGRDYEYKLVMAGHHPGRYHIHPTVMVQEAGPLIGPGSWVDIKGDAASFAYPAKTMDGREIPNLATWNLGTVVSWHALWMLIAVGWLFWWARRPLFIPRCAAVDKGREDVLITKSDVIAGAAVAVGTLVIVIAGVDWANSKYPISVPLQAAKIKIEPLPLPAKTVDSKVVRATYDVPGRSMKLTLRVKNNTDSPVQLGEFTSANVRFLNANVPAAKAGVDPNYPSDLVNTGLNVADNTPIAPGETREMTVDATDGAWEVERLTSLLNDPDNSFGALLFFYDAQGNRHISPTGGPIVPHFV